MHQNPEAIKIERVADMDFGWPDTRSLNILGGMGFDACVVLCGEQREVIEAQIWRTLAI